MVRKAAADNFVFADLTPAAVTALANALNDSESDVRLSAGITMFIAKPAAQCVLPQLIDALDHPDVRVCRLAAACLSNLGHEAAPALPRLRKFGEETDGLLRAWVDETMAKIGRQET